MQKFLRVAPEATSSQPQTKKKTRNRRSVFSQDLLARYSPSLHDYTIDFLHDDKPALLTCSLVCRAWSAASRYHLFQNATIDITRVNFQSFCELLADQRFKSFIGRLHMHSHDNLSDETLDRTFQLNDHLKYLPELPGLKYLHLHHHLPHDEFHPDALAAFTQTRNFANITDLQLTSMHFTFFAQFVQAVSSLPLLRCLTLDRVVFYDRQNGEIPGDAPAPAYTPGNLTDAVVICDYDSAAAIFSWLPSQPFIRRLDVSVDSFGRAEHAPLLSKILHTLGPRLEHLVLNSKRTDTTRLSDLPQTTEVQTFEIAGMRSVQADGASLTPSLHMPPDQDVVFYDRRNGETPGPAHTPGTFTDIVIVCSYDTAPPLFSWLAFQPFIRRLAVSIDPGRRAEYTPVLSGILRALGPRLEHLILDFKRADNSDLIPDISQNTCLHTFEISSVACVKDCNLAWVSTLLSLLCSPVLQRVRFGVFLHHDRFLKHFEWPRIHELLERQPSLRNVQFCVSGYKGGATKVIPKLLVKPRAYEAGLYKGTYRYSLGMFDREWMWDGVVEI
ncbi:hypothetical protein K438DRAFT_1747277 [Mycena galopus ATCC 62051]|nr:hypothetical protein K438DRAFT_1747277 [Mycena galopus ATCC 62051]